MVSIDINLVFTIINLIVFYLLMKKFLIGPINGIMEKREHMIEQQMEQARQTQADAASLKEEYKEALRGAQAESAQMIENARENAKKEYDRILEDASKKSAKMLEDSRKTIEREREQTLQDMQSQIAQLAIAAVGKVLPGEITQEDNNRYYERFLKEAGETGEAGSH
ncbi:MAG: F0F1 ATP synthase subunit B [Lachnospiraceae bacterium]|nr:F0F1 ATP synthase subunit B [Clostridiales bacterium]MDY4771884.1 F0F1 ATP synthase subunit B [Lachnospiraceae bacterium]